MKKCFQYFLLMFFFVFYSIFLSGQNVGIGTSTPSEKLQVEGNILTDTIKLNAIRLSPNSGAGKILTSDDIGNASWQENNIPVNENIGYGVWGDCATNGNISEYLPTADPTGAVNERFGASVAISGNFTIIGANEDDEQKGSASIYQYDGNSWQFLQKLVDATGEPGDFFGISVAISGNYAIVGAEFDNETYSFQGSASIFQYNGSNWELMEKITDPDGAATDYFGFSVSISGDNVIVGSYLDDETYNDQGSASIFHFNGTNWEWIQKITDANGNAGDHFGYSVSISGTYAIAGAIWDDGNLNNQGSASIYQINGNNWELMNKIVDLNGYENDYFGYSVSLSGNYAIVGMIYRNLGGFNDAGSALIFQYDGNNWMEMERIYDANGATSDYFGCSVSISDHYAFVGEYGNNIGSIGDQGSASIYQRVGLGWQRLQEVTDPGGDWEDFFGSAVAIDGSNDRFVVGVPGYANYSGKAVFGKIK